MRHELIDFVWPLVGPRIPVRHRAPVSLGLLPRMAADRYDAVPIFLDRPLDVDPGRGLQLDYRDLADLVEALSGSLTASGVRAWDQVAIAKSPNFDTLILAAAAARIGAIPVLISSRLPGYAIDALLGRLADPFVVTDAPTIAASELGAERWLAHSRCLLAPVEGGFALPELGSVPIPPAEPRRGDEPAYVSHTGSTTGIPKLVQHSVASACHPVDIESRRFPFGYSNRDTVATAFPYVHARAYFGLMAALSRGMRLLPLTDANSENVGALFRRHRPTIVDAPPNVLMDWADDLCGAPGDPFASVRTYFNTFDAAHISTIERLLTASNRRTALYCQAYGMSETGVLTIKIYSRGSVKRLIARGRSRDVGWPVPLTTRVRVVDPRTRQPLPRGKSGLIQARTNGRCIGFMAQPAKYWRRRHGAWLDTGDIGRLTRFGSLELLDREMDRIAGVDSCLSLEDMLLMRAPELTEVIIVAGADGAPVPVVCTRDDRPLDRGSWEAAVTGLPPLQSPVQLSEAELPRTETLKARRVQLSQFAGTSDVGALRPAGLGEGA